MLFDSTLALTAITTMSSGRGAYSAYPIAVEGFEVKSEGTYSRPTMKVANITGLITGINHDFDDALGAVVTRRQVLVKHLDAVNFPNGNADADPTMEAVSRYVIEEMAEETFETVTYNLATPVDCDNAIIPARTISLMCVSGFTAATAAATPALRWLTRKTTLPPTCRKTNAQST